MNDEIVIVENVDDIPESLLPFSSTQSDYALNLQYPGLLSISEATQLKTPEALEPLRTFKSGVISFTGPARRSTVLETLSSSPKMPALLLLAKDENASLSGESYSHMNRKAISVSPNFASPSSESQRPLINASKTQSWVHHEVEILDNLPRPDLYRHGRQLVPEDVSIQIPLLQSDKIRRILDPEATSVITVSMRGSVDLVDIVPLRYVEK
ncbi:hypothetical protein H0H81_007770 [Sphagnurus paluster]|uniref:Uncharacterized protein n=1 Tax=Sphagnurus paluster TaxID=117069 RepID=A0A9P7K666_9AGAR|nr:hypothetical protein H0H81_007770 [Sphagnurus paluster]